MKPFTKAIFTTGLSLLFLLPAATQPKSVVTVDAASYKTTGFTKTSDVDYEYTGSYIHNWGAREEDCTFLSPNAVSFYTGSNTYASLSENSGGSSQGNAYQSDLYRALQSLMKSKHTKQTSYGETRYQYCYTDCELNDSSTISSFYSGTSLSGSWGTGWNREHTWPNSKGLGGNDENDIMMLRPTSTSENSSRGNTAYGKSSSYYNPNSEANGKYDLRGDCARIVLYVYVRWGNTGKMWGSSGVMESMTVLLEWMEADPVDTWEMGRNDAVQSITGTRNVFVDYPEFAWQLFGKEIPDDYTSPSGGESGGSSSGGSSSGGSSSGGSSSGGSSSGGSSSGGSSSGGSSSGGSSSGGSSSGGSSSGGSSSGGSSSGGQTTPSTPTPPDTPDDPNSPHRYSPWILVKEATLSEDGEWARVCYHCGQTETEIIPQTCQHEFSKWITIHTPTAWQDGETMRTCLRCGKTETETTPKTVNGPLILGCSIGGVVVIGGGFGVVAFIKFISKKEN